MDEINAPPKNAHPKKQATHTALATVHNIYQKDIPLFYSLAGIIKNHFW